MNCKMVGKLTKLPGWKGDGEWLEVEIIVTLLYILTNCINNLGDRIECIVTNFGGNTKCGGQQRRHKEEPLFRNTYATGIAYSLTKVNVKIWTWDRKHQEQWRLKSDCLDCSSAERNLYSKLNLSQQCILATMKASCVLDCISKNTADQGMRLSHFTLFFLDHIWKTLSSFGAPSSREVEQLATVSTMVIRGLRNTIYEERLKGLGFFESRENVAQGWSNHSSSTKKGSYRDDGGDVITKFWLTGEEAMSKSKVAFGENWL